jgi:hypothetical protein
MITSIFLNNNNEAATIEVNVGYDENNNIMTESKIWEQLTDRNKQDIASQWVGDHIYCNVNQVMELLAKNDDHHDHGEYMRIAEYQDFEYSSSDHILSLNIDELWEVIEDYDLDLAALEERENNKIDCISQEAIAAYVMGIIDLDQYGQDNDLDPEYEQAYEFWSVSDHFIAMLQDSEQCSSDILGLSVWARYCTGQSICLDCTIQEAAFKVLSDTATSNY